MKTKYLIHLYEPMYGALVYASMTGVYTALTASGLLHLTFFAMMTGTAYFIASLFTARKTVEVALEEYVEATALRGVFARTLYGTRPDRDDAAVDMLIDSAFQAAVTHFIPKRAKHYITARVVQFLLFITAIFASVAVLAAHPDIAQSELAKFSLAFGCLGLPCEIFTARMWRPYQSDVTQWVAEHLGLEKKTA